MSDVKKSFVLYTDYQENILLLSKEQRGDLLTLIMAYASGDTLPAVDGVTQMAFSFIKSQMDKDAEKYSGVIEKRREAGKQGGRPKVNGSDEKAKKANGFSEKQSEAKKPDNGFINVNDNDYVKDIKDNIVPPPSDKPEPHDLKYSEDSFEMRCVNSLVQSVLGQFQGAKVPKDFDEKQKWCVEVDRMKRLDKHSEQEIEEALKFAMTDVFWKKNILSISKFRKQFDKLIIQARNKGKDCSKKTNRFHNLDEHGYDYNKIMWDTVNSREVPDVLPE